MQCVTSFHLPDAMPELGKRPSPDVCQRDDIKMTNGLSHVLLGQHVPVGCLEVMPISSSPLSTLSMVSVKDAVE